MSDAYLLAGARTPIGKFLGGLKDFSAPELGALAIRACLEKAHASPDRVDEVIMGNVLQAGVGQAPARQAALKAGLPNSIAAVTINKVCGSGLKAVMMASQAIRAGDARLIVAGGMESMSRAPHLAQGLREGAKLGDVTLNDALIFDGLQCAFEGCHMGEHAEYTARANNLRREELDALSLASHQRAITAISTGVFREEIVPITIQRKGSETTIENDEGPRAETNLAALAKLKPVFDPEGVVTAGNASMLSDGAAAVLVGDRQSALELDAGWTARIVSCHTAGKEPRDLFTAPVDAIRGALTKAGLQLSDIDLFEINEAFASQMLACLRLLELDPEKVNVAGGAISLGHPIGASGARVLVTLMSLLKQRDLRRGCASLCLGGGNAVAMIIERV